MSSNKKNENPLLVRTFSTLQKARQSFTVQYKNRFLYSKYDPQKSIENAIASAKILPGTLVLVFSPCLFYGIESLAKKCGANLGKNIFVVAIEADKKLYELSKKIFRKKNPNKNCAKKNAHSIQLFPHDLLLKNGTTLFLQNLFFRASQKSAQFFLPPPGTFKRVVQFDFCAGVFFNADFYKQFFFLAQNAIAQFWKNRLSLAKLGRLYCKNFFKNLSALPFSAKFEFFEKTVFRPIIVLGAGESLEDFIKNFNPCLQKKFFIIAVDAAALPLYSAHIIPNAIVASEAQIAIEKAFVGIKNAAKNFSPPILFCDMVLRHTIAHITGFFPCFYFSEFEKNFFILRTKKSDILPKIFPPLGSVGLIATYIAMLLRKTENVPIYVSGMDFSFSLGKTHANGTFQHTARLLQNFRLSAIQNYEAAFCFGTEKIFDNANAQKNFFVCEKKIFSSKNLLSYITLFKENFGGKKNIFDIAKNNIDLGIEKKSFENCADFFQTLNSANKKNESEKKLFAQSAQKIFTNESAQSLFSNAMFGSTKKISHFLKKELRALFYLKSILSKKSQKKNCDKSIFYKKQILLLLENMEYLYLHFPDGAQPNLEENFLKRVCIQIDFFIKEIESAQKNCHTNWNEKLSH